MSVWVKDITTGTTRRFTLAQDAEAWIARSPETRKRVRSSVAMRDGYVSERYAKDVRLPDE